MSDQIQAMELARLQVGDVILSGRNWEIISEEQVVEPNAVYETDEFGNWKVQGPKYVRRLRFDCLTGAWSGYLFPHNRTAAYLKSNGFGERIVGAELLPESLIVRVK